jgi:acetyl esterase/lipase
MNLWPEELEAHRAEAREFAAAARTLLPPSTGSVTDDREAIAARRAMVAAFERPSPAGVDATIVGVPCRVFSSGSPERGTYLHFHGGALIMGSALLNDSSNARIAERCGVEVVSVNYRLAPEHPFPAAPDDCFAVAKHLALESDRRLVIGGESAGAYLAVLTLIRLRDELGLGDRVRAASLTYGVYDLSGTPSNRGVHPDVDPLHPRRHEQLTLRSYLPGGSLEDARDPLVSPLYADLRELPPALFTVGSADRLVDDTLFMARRWELYGNEVELAVYPDCDHSFLGLPIELARRAAARIDRYLDDAFA